MCVCVCFLFDPNELNISMDGRREAERMRVIDCLCESFLPGIICSVTFTVKSDDIAEL